MFKLFKKKPDLPHIDLLPNAEDAIRKVFNTVTNNHLKEIYRSHYGEEPSTNLHLDFARQLVENFKNKVMDDLFNFYKEEHRMIATSLEFIYTPYPTIGKVHVQLKLSRILAWHSTGINLNEEAEDS